MTRGFISNYVNNEWQKQKPRRAKYTHESIFFSHFSLNVEFHWNCSGGSVKRSEFSGAYHFWHFCMRASGRMSMRKFHFSCHTTNFYLIALCTRQSVMITTKCYVEISFYGFLSKIIEI